MCRIAGIVDRQRSPQIVNDVVLMRDSMQHGGPDSAGVYEDSTAGLAFGHRRLSIIDLSDGGRQPMHSDAGHIVLSYNGEVYNYLDLKKELAAAGCSFHTSSDTEVIIQAYTKWGVESFGRLKGMFAFSLYDRRSGELYLVRDQQGIKPLYYALDNDSLYFASEIRAFKALNRKWQENSDWKIYFLTYGYLPEPVTTLQGVKPLAKGSYLKINVKTFEHHTKFYASHQYSGIITDEQQAVAAVREVLNKAVERHLISDAPIGLFLSGGIDSSLLTLIASKAGNTDLHTLSIIFNDKAFSEKEYQDLIAGITHSKHRAYELTKDMFLDAMPDILQAMDQPTSDGVNTYFICKFAKAYGLKAVLSGLGADELFGGYSSFSRGSLLSRMNAAPSALLSATEYFGADKYRKISFLSRKDAVGEYLFHRGFFNTLETSRILDADVKEVRTKLKDIAVPGEVETMDYGNRTSYLESNLYMQGQLLKDTDMMSMWHSIEVRVPFLDTDVVNLAHSIAPEVKFNKEQIKYLLVAAYKDILPEQIWNRKKQGFVFPFQNWMNGNEDSLFRHADERIKTRYKNNRLNWSRYWTYLVANNYTTA